MRRTECGLSHRSYHTAPSAGCREHMNFPLHTCGAKRAAPTVSRLGDNVWKEFIFWSVNFFFQHIATWNSVADHSFPHS